MAGRIRAAAAFAALSLIGCARNSAVPSAKPEPLFSLEYGSFDEQLNLFGLAGSGQVATSMTMRDGFFYIANGGGKKIMELNSYGSMVGLCYNAEADGISQGGSAKTVRKLSSYPFNTLGPIAVDSKKSVYVAETLPPERQSYNAEKKLRLNQVVLKFKPDGSFDNFIGQQGPGGTPFPLISKVFCVRDDELVVVCVTNEGPAAYWFSSDGYLLFQIPVGQGNIPNPFSAEGREVIAHVDSLVPDAERRILHVKIDYEAKMEDPALRVQSGIAYEATMVYPLDVSTGAYGEPFAVPPFEMAVGAESHACPYDFMGVAQDGWFFFSAADGRGCTVQMIRGGGREIKKMHLDIDFSALEFCCFDVDPQGIISALMAGSASADIVWWRTDRAVSEDAGIY